MENYIHFEAINEEFDIQLNENFCSFDDVPVMVAKLVHEASDSRVDWDDLDEKKKGKKESKAKKRLNRDGVSNMTMARLHSADPDGEVLTWLEEISKHLR